MHSNKLSWLVLAALSVGAAGTCVCVAADTSHVTNGKRLFLADGCFECHGRVGEGGAFNGPAPPLAGIFSRRSMIEIFAAVRKGPNDMPAYTAKVLPDKDLYDIIAYIRSLPGPSDPKNFPLLNK